MSAPEQPASISIDSSLSSMQFSLVDSSFNEVANGTGRLRAADLRPGIYELRLSAGTVADTRLISVRAGEEHSEVADLAFPAATPLRRSSTWDPRHELAAEEASRHIVRSSNQGDAPEGGLLLMARATREGDVFAHPPELELTRRTALAGDAHFDLDFEEAVPADTWLHDSGPDWVIRAAAVEPGGYGLRVRQGESASEQPVWVARGWQTLVFLPDRGEGIEMSRASIGMAPMTAPWDPRHSLEGAQVTELALAGLREHRSVLPEDLRFLLEGKFSDPMMGIVGAHSLLLSPAIDFEQFDVVMQNLQRLLGRLPDVVALEVLGAEARAAGGEEPAGGEVEPFPIVWPPMLLAGYAALVRHDAFMGGGTIVPGSLAQTVAGRLRGDCIWTTWTVGAAEQEARRRRRAGLLSRFRTPPLGETLRRIEPAEPETQQVAAYLATVADVELPESFQDMLQTALGSPANIAAATTLPLLSVNDAIETIAEMSSETRKGDAK